MSSPHDGIFDANSTYSHKAIGRMFGKSDRWVREEILHNVPHRKVGDLYLVGGHLLQLWVERGSSGWDDDEPAVLA